MERFKFPLQKGLERSVHAQRRETGIFTDMQTEYGELERRFALLKQEYELLKARHENGCTDSAGAPADWAGYIGELRSMLRGVSELMAKKQLTIGRHKERLEQVAKNRIKRERFMDNTL